MKKLVTIYIPLSVQFIK